MFEIHFMDPSKKQHIAHVDADEIEALEETYDRTSAMELIAKRDGRKVGRYINVTGYHEQSESESAAGIVEGDNPWMR